MPRLALAVALLALGAVLTMPAAAAAPSKPPSAKRAAFAVNALGIALERRAGRGNVAVSPWSAWSALTMAYAGSAGQTRAEMARVLHVRTFGGATGDANRRLTRALEASAKASHARLDIANGLWGDRAEEFRDPFLETLRDDYGAPLRRDDFAHDPSGTRVRINRWVADHTNQRIKELFRAGDVTEDTRLAMVNALYLKARWRLPFEPGLTRKRPFHAPRGRVLAETMSQTANLPYARLRHLRAVALPYRRGRLSMLILLPDRGHMKAVQRKLSPAGVRRIAGALRRRQLDLSMPRFRVATRLSLDAVLARLGMGRAFSDSAEFPGISPEPLELGAAVQKVWIRVGEKGTEAAAATGITMVPSSGVFPPPRRLAINRPFLFLVRDNRTGALLFLGRVQDPTK
jgi:serpin B